MVAPTPLVLEKVRQVPRGSLPSVRSGDSATLRSREDSTGIGEPPGGARPAENRPAEPAGGVRGKHRVSVGRHHVRCGAPSVRRYTTREAGTGSALGRDRAARSGPGGGARRERQDDDPGRAHRVARGFRRRPRHDRGHHVQQASRRGAGGTARRGAGAARHRTRARPCPDVPCARARDPARHRPGDEAARRPCGGSARGRAVGERGEPRRARRGDLAPQDRAGRVTGRRRRRPRRRADRARIRRLRGRDPGARRSRLRRSRPRRRSATECRSGAPRPVA